MSGGLELVKWLAFAAMVADHVDFALFDRSQPLLHAIGRFAMPAFAVAFGIGLARSADPLHVAARLVGPALVAQLAWALLTMNGTPHPANILVAFACLALLESIRRTWPAAAVGALVALLWASSELEGGYVVLLLVAGAVVAERLRMGELHGLGVAVVAFAIPSPGAFLGVLAPHVGRRVYLELPRAAGVLAWAYAAHLAVLAALRPLFT